MAFARSIRDYQIRVNSLGILVVPLTVDAQPGVKTEAAIKAAMAHLKVKNREEIFHPSGITRIHWHWTAGDDAITIQPGPNNDEGDHYNDVWDAEGKHFKGGAPAIDQAFYTPDGRGVSHTLSANTGAIGLSVAAMGDSTSSGNLVSMGKWPLNWVQLDAMLKTTMAYCKEFDVRPSKWTTLSHAEIQPTLGIFQKGKWDIRVLPDNPTKLLDAVIAGDILRKRMIEKFGSK